MAAADRRTGSFLVARCRPVGAVPQPELSASRAAGLDSLGLRPQFRVKRHPPKIHLTDVPGRRRKDDALPSHRYSTPRYRPSAHALDTHSTGVHALVSDRVAGGATATMTPPLRVQVASPPPALPLSTGFADTLLDRIEARTMLDPASGSSATVTAAGQSSSTNDTYIQVSYTLNGQSATVLDEITVRDPSGLAIVTDSGTEQDYNCQANGLGNYTCGDQRFIQYEVTDQLGAVQVAGIPVSEDLAPGVNTCAVTPTPRGGQTDSSGEVSQPDQLVLCTSACSTGVCPPPGSCQLAVTQKWYANGILVRTNSLVYGCKSITVNGG